jgi:hypothetical protein
VLISSEKGFKWLYRFFASRELTIAVFAVLCLFLAITTFIEENSFIIWNIVRILLTLTVINLSLCTLQRIKNLSKPVLMIHIGVILTFIGGGISSYGFVATVYIYEGTLAKNVYRWDIKEDISIGADIMVKKLHEEYYPVPVKVGVLRDEKKVGLYKLKTGEKFILEKHNIKIDSIDISSKSLKLSIFYDDDYIGSADTLGASDLPPDFPFEFKLVAYMDPTIKRTWVDLALIKGSEIVAEGRTEINDPLHWNGMSFYHTATNRDKSGKPFIGIQITKDPGVVIVYLGFSIFCIGGVFYLLRRVRGLR